MKISVFLLLVTFFNVFAGNTYSQNTRLSLDMKDVPMQSVFKAIEGQSEFFFLYSSKMIDVDQKVNIDVSEKNISEVLDELLGDTEIKYTVKDRQILLVNKEAEETLGLQQKQITGKIVDETGSPMIGVTVLVKGTTLGTVTDMNGNYSISGDIPNNAILVYSFVGYGNKEIAVAGKSVIDVALEADVTALNEVVVIGYGTARRSDLVGSTSSISTKDVINQPAARVDQVLQGRSPGIAVQNNSAAPNGAFTIRIRGSNSLQGSNDPLVVIDGFIGGDLTSLNPNDISNIEILKDASSTAIYGSRGANGVILVTTKKGALNSTVVEYNNFVNFQSVSKRMDLLTAAEYAETVNANRIEVGRPVVFSDQQIADYRANGGTDWQDQIFRNTIQQSHQVSVSGGTNKSIFYVSGNYTSNDGVIKGSSFSQYSLRSNLETDIGNKFKIGANVYLARAENHPAVTGGSQDQSPVQGALIWGAVQPVYKEDGVTYTRPASNYGPPAVNNPLAMAIEPINDNIAVRAELNTFINYEIIEGLSARVLFGTRLLDQQNSQYLNTKPAGNLGDASASIIDSRTQVLQNTNQLNYQKKIGAVHDISLTAAYEQQREVFNNAYAGARGFSSDATSYNNLGLGTKPQIPTSSYTRKDIQSFVGRVNYSFMEKYLVSLTSRYDGASVFGTDKWGFFPSAAVAWRISSEDFMDNFTTISNLKLRTSYGITGSQAVAPYASLSQLNTSQAYAIGSSVQTGIGLGTYGNPDLRWEKTAQLNIGIDLGLFNGRLVFNADFYNKNTSDLLMAVPLPRVSGYTSILQNIGEVQNRGFEFNLGGDPLNGELRWNTSINFAVNDNKVLALAGTDEIPIGNTGFPNFGNTIYLKVGEPMGFLKGYIQDGTWGTAEAAEAAGFGTIPGAPKYIDQNLDGKITNSDIVKMGTTLPTITYGWSNDFSYKNFDLNILIQGSAGNMVYNQTRIRSERTSSDADATDRRILNRWTPENQNTSVPSFTGSTGYEQLQSNRWLENGSYVRFKNITLGYNFSSSLLSKVKISSARVFVSGVNLFTFTEYTGYDPEASTNVGTLGGIDQAPYPSQKMYSVGVNVRF